MKALLLVVALAGCGMAPQSAPPSAAAPVQTLPGDPRTEIEELDAQITARLGEAGIVGTDATCGNACTAQPLGLPPRTEDTTCKAPAPTTTCTEKCTLSDAICKNADRICELAGQLGGADAWANGKCQSGNASCSKARAQCCGCT